MQIKVVFIPAATDEPAVVKEIDGDDIHAYQKLIGGDVEVLRLFHPRGRLLVNMEGLAKGLPANPRATALALMHHANITLNQEIVGEAVLTGPLDRVGFELEVPTRYLVELEAK